MLTVRLQPTADAPPAERMAFQESCANYLIIKDKYKGKRWIFRAINWQARAIRLLR